MNLPEEIESALIAGRPVKFVYLDPDGNTENDSEFTARCHFIPRIGDKVILGSARAPAYVKSIYHTFQQTDEFEKGVFFQAVTVALTAAPNTPPERASH